MASEKPEGAQAFATELQPPDWAVSPELSELLDALSPAQAAGVIRIAQAELAGQSIESLFKGPDKICSRSTFYSKSRGGWIHKPRFVAALVLARHEVRAHRLTSVVHEAVEELKLATLIAAKDLRRQLTGDETAITFLAAVLSDDTKGDDERERAARALGQIGSAAAAAALVAAIETVPDPLRLIIVDALGLAGVGADVQRRMAAIAVLDRAAKDTADKAGSSQAEDLSDEELARIVHS